MKKEKRFYTLSSDIIFKNTFDTDDSLKRLLEETLNLKVEEIHKNNIELSVDNNKERRKYLDLILKTDKGTVNVEINHGYKDELPNRNFLYFCKLISSSVRKNKSYTNVDRHIQLNITWNLEKYLKYNVDGRRIIYCHLSDDESHEKMYDDIFEIVYINMDYFEKVWYDGNEKEENPFLMLLAASTEKQMERISEGDRLMEELNDKVKKLNEDPEVLDVIIENEEEIIANSLFESGIKKGISQGISQGIEQNKIDIAKKMLKEKLDISLIKKITGLTDDEIKTAR